eukprot:m51a1_g7181 bis(5'-nucleosyl)-tetraphosphatase (asymmetrical), putative (149) ;mRNA; f:84096-84771
MVRADRGSLVDGDLSAVPEEKSCGFVIYQRTANGLVFLLLKHRGGHWDSCKGHIHKKETELETAFRELREETGLKKHALEIVPNVRIAIRYRTPRRHSLKLALQASEILEARWLGLADLDDPSLTVYGETFDVLHQVSALLSKQQQQQ